MSLSGEPGMSFHACVFVMRVATHITNLRRRIPLITLPFRPRIFGVRKSRTGTQCYALKEEACWTLQKSMRFNPVFVAR